MKTDWPISAALVVLAALLGFVANRYLASRAVVTATALRLAEANERLIARVTELEKQSALLGQAVLPISDLFRAALIKELTHNHTPEMDDLMARVDDLTDDELNRLTVLLRERVVEYDDPLITESERDAATILPIVMKRVQVEHREAAESGVVSVRLMTVTVRQPP